MEKSAIVYKRTVVNIIMGTQEACDVIAKWLYGDEASAVSTGSADILIGDRYKDGIFYRMDKSGRWVPLGGAA